MAIAVNVVAVRRRHWRHVLVLTSDKYFQLTTIQVSYNSIVCNSVEHIEFCAWKLRFADSIDFLLNLKKTAAESHRMLVEAYGELLVNHSVLNGLKNSKVAILTWETKNVENHWKSSKTANCKHCWMRMTLKLNNNSRINWMWHKKLSPYVWNPRERSRRWENGFHMNERQQENRKTTCEMLLVRYKRYELWLAVKSGYILRILSVKDHG